LVINPYLIQIKYSSNAKEFNSLIGNLKNLNTQSIGEQQLILQDLKQIAGDYPDKTFVIGNKPDGYDTLAFYYWGGDIKEFVSIQDYELFLNNDSTIFEKTLKLIPTIQDRREIWIAGGMNKNENDKTDYNSIEFGIGINEPINLENFEIIKKYNLLYLSQKKLK